MYQSTTTSANDLDYTVVLALFLKNVSTVKVSKAFKQSVARRLDLMTLGSREKHLNLLSQGGVLVS